MVSEVSILIPVYNQNVLALVETLRQEASSLPITFEIRVYDDGSNPETQHQNKSLKGVLGVVYQGMSQNIGRSQIRYKLAQEARFATLLFLDNDVQPVYPDFLQRYLAAGDEGVAVGGVAYKGSPPAGQELRWKYGKSREEASARERQKNPYQRVFSSNLFLPKEVFLACFPKNELSGYGHEDTLFAWRLQQHNIPVQHIDNPVWHLGLEPAEVFLLKSQQAIHNLVLLYQKYGLGEETKLMKAHASLTKWKVGQLLRENSNWLFPLLKKNLVSRRPNLHMFDLYRLLLLDKYLKK
ncbi:glycosyltransferase family 2 protein [Rufibacter hautae]|uniref:Glycosyltransferase family 2 protein n=1 Tax=Rufibacter hautae TaxID=2595005 RepID=A0A5B6TGZ3_9BACT|nr:glycosyltransferase family 2 protein [Rufibacter hautae]KAA3438585.1 glycosyltransferase family 2 protein [Rufibacter hautae]